MPFRDDREAAHARADALTVELAEREARLEAKERELAAARSELERARRGESPTHSSEPAGTELARRDARAEAARQLRPGNQSSVEKERVKRFLRSVDGDLDGVVLAWVIALVLAVASIAGFIEAGWLLGALAGVGAVSLALGSLKLEQRGRERSLTREFEWAATRPYALLGYPALLDQRPNRDAKLTIRIAFDGEEPAELDPVLSTFDSQLQREEVGVYSRTSPVVGTEEESDHNLAVHYWFKQCASEVLGPLHRSHGLSRVELSLD